VFTGKLSEADRLVPKEFLGRVPQKLLHLYQLLETSDIPGNELPGVMNFLGDQVCSLTPPALWPPKGTFSSPTFVQAVLRSARTIKQKSFFHFSDSGRKWIIVLVTAKVF